MAEKLTTLAKRLRPFILGHIQNVAASGGLVNEGPGIDLVGNYVGLGGDTILQYSASWIPVAEFAPTDAGLVSALAALASGDALILPSGTIPLTSAHTLPDSTAIVGFGPKICTLDLSGGGTITLGNLSILYGITVNNTQSSANAIYGVLGPDTGAGYVINCDVTATQAGAGNAYAIGAINGITAADGGIYADDCYLYGSSVGGSGYAARSTHGIIRITGNTRGNYGSTDRYTTL